MKAEGQKSRPKPVEFKILREGKSTYVLGDGSKLVGRVIVLKVMKAGPEEYGIKSSSVFVVYPPDRLAGEPSRGKPPTEELTKRIVEEDIDLNPEKEEWNTFQVNGVTLSVKLVVTKVSRTDQFDETGDPLYVINSEPVIKMSRAK